MSSPLPPPTSAPAGWYPDPSGSGVRYFDGRAWTPTFGAPAFAARPPHPTLPISAAIGALVTLIVSLLVGRQVGEWMADAQWPVVPYLVVLVLVNYGPSVAWAWHVRRSVAGGTWAGLGWQFRWGDLWRGPVTYLVSVGVQLIVGALILLLGVPYTSNVDDVGDLDATTRSYRVAIVIVLVVAAPVVEEIIFRGVVLRGFLSRMPVVVAIVAQGVLFGSAHVDPVRGAGNIGLAIALSMAGIVLGGSAYLTRRIGPTVIAHAILNGVVVIILFSGVLDDVDVQLDAIAWVGSIVLSRA